MLKFCYPKDDGYLASLNTMGNKTLISNTLPLTITVNHDIIIEDYFKFLDSITSKYDYHIPGPADHHRRKVEAEGRGKNGQAPEKAEDCRRHFL